MKDPNNQGAGVNNIFMTKLENICIIDSGCPKSVMSQMWADTYKASLMNNEKLQDFHFREKREYKLFKFGPSQVYSSTRSMMIPIVLGNEVKEVEVSIIHNHQQGEEGQVVDEQARPHPPQGAGHKDGKYQDQKYIPLEL